MTGLLERVPPPIRSLWNSEVALRRGVWASIFNRGQPNPHYAEARRHLGEALSGFSSRPPSEQDWGGKAHVDATLEQDKIDERTAKPFDPSKAPRF